MLKVTLRRLEVFVAVVDEGSFVAAADRFGIAQPSVSAHIRALEREVSGLVFERRRGRKPTLTDLGRSLLNHAREFMAEADDLDAAIVKVKATQDRSVVFSCQRSLANFVLKQQIVDFANTHPEIQLIVRIGTQEDVIAEVREGVADVGCFLSNEDVRGLNSEVIGTQRLFIVAAPSHPLAGRSHVRPSEVRQHGFVGPPPASLFGRAVYKLLAGAGMVDVSVVAQATEYPLLRELVAAQIGLSCSPEKSVEADIASGNLVVVDLDAPELRFDIRLILSSRRPHSSSSRAFMRFLRRSDESV